MNDRSSRLQISASRISNMNFGIIRINLLVLWGIAGYNEGYNPNMHNFVFGYFMLQFRILYHLMSGLILTFAYIIMNGIMIFRSYNWQVPANNHIT